MPYLRAQNLSRQFNGHQAVKSLDLSLDKGEILGLLGPNGAGKSTTLQIITGCLRPSEGQVEIMGKSLSSDRSLQKHIGYLPERPPLYDSFTVYEQLDYAARLYGLNKEERGQRCATVIQLCELKEVRQTIIGKLSKGFRQRVGIAQALVHNPEIIILDEPTDGLDPMQMQSLRNLIIELGKNHAVLLSSHLLNEVETVCSRVIILHQGKQLFNEHMDKLKTSGETLEAVFTRLIFHDNEAAA